MHSLILQAAGAFGAGLGTSLSPCVYPMIPITVGYLGAAGSAKAGGQRRVVGFFLGQVATFTALGVVAVLLGEILGFSSEIPSVQIGTGFVLLACAYFSLTDRLPGIMQKLNRFQGLGSSATLGGAFLMGASSAAIASPCTSPVVGGVLAALSQVHERGRGIFLMFCFSLGLSALFLAIGLGLARVRALPRAGNWMRVVHKGSGVLLALGGAYFLARGFRLT